MADKKKLKKKLKKLSKSEAELKALFKLAKKEAKKLKKALKRREELIEELDEQIQHASLAPVERASAEPTLEELMEMEIDPEIVATQKQMRKYSRYLGEQYTYYLENGVAKGKARDLANKDLMEKYGEAAGFAKDALEDILS